MKRLDSPHDTPLRAAFQALKKVELDLLQLDKEDPNCRMRLHVWVGTFDEARTSKAIKAGLLSAGELPRLRRLVEIESRRAPLIQQLRQLGKRPSEIEKFLAIVRTDQGDRAELSAMAKQDESRPNSAPRETRARVAEDIVTVPPGRKNGAARRKERKVVSRAPAPIKPVTSNSHAYRNASSAKLEEALRSSVDPVEEGNPFAESDPRHIVWETATLAAEEEIHRLNSHLLETVATGSVEHDGRAIAQTSAKFDIWAKRYIQVVWSRRDLPGYDAWLFTYAEAWLKIWEPRVRNHLPVFPVILRNTLLSRVEHWKAEARRYLAEHERRVIDSGPGPGGRPRKDEERDEVRKMKADGKSWKDIATEMNEKHDQDKTPEAYRALLRANAGKNVQN